MQKKKLNDSNWQKDADDSLSKQVEEVNAQLSAETTKNQSMAADLEKANSALASTTAEVGTLKGKLEELEAHLKRADASKEAELQVVEHSPASCVYCTVYVRHITTTHDTPPPWLILSTS